MSDPSAMLLFSFMVLYVPVGVEHRGAVQSYQVE